MIDTPTQTRAAREEKSSLGGVREFFRSLMPGRGSGSLKDAIEEAIEEVLEEHEESVDAQLAPEEKNLLRNVLTFGDITVHDIMIPRTDIQAVAMHVTLEDLKKHIIEQRHTRIPVYRDTLDQIEGFLHVKDLFPMIAGDAPFALARVMRPLLFVPPSMRILDLLVQFKRQGSHMAVVVDEYGGTDGLLTLEDVFEEIVGDIQDEHDEEDAAGDLMRVRDGVYEADARVRIKVLEAELGLQLMPGESEEEFDTLAGLIFFELGRVPTRGEVVQHDNLRFEILEADPRSIKRVRISKMGSSMSDETMSDEKKK